MPNLSKSYDPKLSEEKWYNTWINEKHFEGKKNHDSLPFSIMIPPPNVTGILHM